LPRGDVPLGRWESPGNKAVKDRQRLDERAEYRVRRFWWGLTKKKTGGGGGPKWGKRVWVEAQGGGAKLAREVQSSSVPRERKTNREKEIDDQSPKCAVETAGKKKKITRRYGEERA